MAKKAHKSTRNERRKNVFNTATVCMEIVPSRYIIYSYSQTVEWVNGWTEDHLLVDRWKYNEYIHAEGYIYSFFFYFIENIPHMNEMNTNWICFFFKFLIQSPSEISYIFLNRCQFNNIFSLLYILYDCYASLWLLWVLEGVGGEKKCFFEHSQNSKKKAVILLIFKLI